MSPVAIGERVAHAPLYVHPDRNLALELVRATEAAAIRAWPFIGHGDKNAADGAAVDAMRKFLGTVDFAGTVVIGEGEKDEGLIRDIRAAGAATRLLLDGDVAGGIDAASGEGRLDLCVGVGGSPEGVATACAVKALGGLIQTRLTPKDEAERRRGAEAGLRFDHVYEADELVSGDNTVFVATGVTDGNLVSGVRRLGPIIRTESIVLRSHSGTIRRVLADHLAAKWLDEDRVPSATEGHVSYHGPGLAGQ